MDIIMQETKKCLIKKYMLVLWLILLALKTFYGLQLQGESRFVSSGLEECRTSYMEYMNRWQGKLSDSKKTEIEKYLNTYHERADIHSRMGDAQYFKEIPRSEYIEELISFQKAYGDEKAVSILENQYDYMMQNRENRYLVYYNGWVNFFESLGQDIFLLVLIVPTLLLLCCREYDSGMYVLNRTTKMGRKMLYWNKVIVGVIFSVLFTGSFYVVGLCVSQIKYGLYGWNYPVQSIHIFADCPWRICIGGMAVMAALLSMFGMIFLIAVVFLCAAIMKKVIPVGVVAMACLLLPIFLFGDGVYGMPLPTGFFQLKGYILGIYNEENMRTEYFTKKELLGVIGISLLIIAACFGISYFLYQEKRLFLRKISTCVPGILIVAFALSGCGGENPAGNGKSTVFNNIGFGNLSVSDDYVVDICNEAMLHTANEKQAIFRNPFEKYDKEKIFIRNIVGDIFYYIYSEDEFHLTEYEIHALNLKTLDDKIIYEDKKYDIRGVPYLGIGDNGEKMATAESYSENEMLTNWWMTDREIILVRNHSVYSVDIKSGKKKLMISDAEGDIFSYAGRTIYYVDTTYALMSYSLDTGKKEKLCKEFVSQICASDKILVYQTMDGENYAYCFADGTVKKLAENQDTMIYADNCYMYFKGDQSCYRVENESAKKEIVSSGREVIEVMSSKDGREVYVVELDGERECLRMPFTQ